MYEKEKASMGDEMRNFHIQKLPIPVIINGDYAKKRENIFHSLIMTLHFSLHVIILMEIAQTTKVFFPFRLSNEL